MPDKTGGEELTEVRYNSKVVRLTKSQIKALSALADKSEERYEAAAACMRSTPGIADQYYARYGTMSHFKAFLAFVGRSMDDLLDEFDDEFERRTKKAKQGAKKGHAARQEDDD